MDLDTLHRMASAGNNKAEKRLFEALTARFNLLVQQRILKKADCEEIVQDTLTAIAEKYKEIKITRSFAAWAYKIFNNALKNHYRAKKYHLSKMGRFREEITASEMNDIDPMLKSRLIGCLKKVGRRNTRYVRILNLYYQGYSGQEIGDKIRITRNNAYSLFSRARSMLKKCLQDGEFLK